MIGDRWREYKIPIPIQIRCLSITIWHRDFRLSLWISKYSDSVMSNLCSHSVNVSIVTVRLSLYIERNLFQDKSVTMYWTPNKWQLSFNSVGNLWVMVFSSENRQVAFQGSCLLDHRNVLLDTNHLRYNKYQLLSNIYVFTQSNFIMTLIWKSILAFIKFTPMNYFTII